MARQRVLVTIELDGGLAGVVRDRDGAWLTDAVARGGVTRIDDHRPNVIGVEGDRSLEGGLLPAGAVAAEVVDDAGERRAAAAGGGAWAIVLDQPAGGDTSPVCFRDARGELVVPVLAPAWPRAPVLDAGEPCPACARADGWDELRASDESRGTSGSDGTAVRPTPFAVCRACGHEHSIGGWFGPAAGAPEPDAAELARMRRAADAHVREEARIALRDVSFPIYAATRDRAPRIAGWGSSDGTLSSVSVEHGARGADPGPRLRIATERERLAYESELTIARSALRGNLDEFASWPERSNAGRAIWLHVREREHRAIVARAPFEERTLAVDGATWRFVVVAARGRWVAVGRRGDLAITIAARDVAVDEVELLALEDVERALCSM